MPAPGAPALSTPVLGSPALGTSEPGAPAPATTVPPRRASYEPARDDAALDWRITFPGMPALVAVARGLVRAALGDCPRRDDIELVTSELVTNAVRHTPGGATGAVVTLRIRATTGRARVEVADGGDPSWTEPESAGDEEEYGRGLTIVRMLADRAGHEPEPGGQVCWAEIHWDVPRPRTTDLNPARPI